MENIIFAFVGVASSYFFLVYLVVFCFRKAKNKKGNFAFKTVMSLFWLTICGLLCISTLATAISIPSQYHELLKTLDNVDNKIKKQ